jgi:hypothetical protein
MPEEPPQINAYKSINYKNLPAGSSKRAMSNIWAEKVRQQANY